MALRRAKLLRLENLAQINLLALAIRHLDSNHRLARHRRLDSHRRRPQRHREVVREVDDLAHLDSGPRLQLIHRDDRPGLDLHHPPLDTKVRELLFEYAGTAFQRGFIDLRMFERRHIEQRLGGIL